jgi:hypothetical protein
MNIKKISNSKIIIQFSKHELTILSNSISETLKEIDDWEFAIRVGAEPEEARLLLNKINKAKEILTQDENRNESDLELSLDEALILNNILNEVTHGFYIKQFENHIGDSEDNVRLFLININKACKTMYSLL